MFAPIRPRPIIPICMHFSIWDRLGPPVRSRSSSAVGPLYCTTTAVPLTVTISMLPLVPTVS